jgi:hypothetical protein
MRARVPLPILDTFLRWAVTARSAFSRRPPAQRAIAWYTLKFVLNGSLLTGYLNGTRVIETTDTTCTTGVIGVGSTGGSTFEADEIAVNRLAGACDAGLGVPKAAGTVCRAQPGLAMWPGEWGRG